MHLKKLQLTGFKTFADKTEILFSQGVTAIVGPNGSGKSNIADSLLWVLGETKASAVRGTKAADVIFNGSARRKQLGIAEVSLTVDNSDNSLPLAFDEVTITRRAYRNGEGEYFINKAHCRLKDIYELFLDTGVGREAYALVNQSEIDSVLSADPETRRGLFEEAAGIKKFRVKKREAIKKLEATEANLTRIRDILSETDAQVEPMREQAEIAIRYNALRKSLTDIEQDYLILELRSAYRHLEEAKTGRTSQDEVAISLVQELSDAQEKADLIAELLTSAEALLDDARRRHSAASSALERAQSEKSLAAQRADGLKAQLRLIDAELENLSGSREESLSESSSLAVEAKAARETQNALAQTLRQTDEAFREVTSKIAQVQKQEERRRAESLRIARDQALKQAELARAEARLAEAQSSIPSLIEDRIRLESEIETIAKNAEETASKIENLTVQVRDAEQALADAGNAVKSAKEASKEAQSAADSARGQRVSLSARLHSLEDLEAAQEGYHQGVKAVLIAAKRGEIDASFTVVADAFNAPPGLETALETALGGSLQDIITYTEAEAKDGIEHLKRTRQGRATFLPLERMRPMRSNISLGRARSMPGFLGAAMDLIEFDPKFRPALDTLLGRVLVCETLDDALDVSRTADGWGRIVTLTGEIVSPTGAMTGGFQQKKSGSLLGRKTELAELRQKLDEQNRIEEQTRIDLEATRTAISDAELNVSKASEEVGANRLALASARQDQERFRRETQKASELLGALRRRIEQSDVTIAQLKASVAEYDSQLAGSQMASAGAESQSQQDRDELAALSVRQENIRAKLMQDKVELATLTEKANSLERSVSGAQSASDRLESQIRKRREQRDLSQQELGQLEERSSERETACETAQQNLAAEKAKMDDAVLERQKLQEASHAATLRARELSEIKSSTLETIRKHELAEQRFEIQTNQISQRLLDEYDITAESALSLEEDPTPPKDAPREVARLRRDLRAMGDVNTGAAEEFERMIQRREFLDTQKQDSEEAKEKILAAISEIDESTRDIFMASFNEVGVAFNELFQRLFNGGETQLQLTKPDDLLETGVEIIVQLPGKKKQNLQLLSGGERALTAVSLLFAFLKVRPAPFCLLDEVDAPLDGVNVERFADLLRDFGTETQFLVITHNPSTMEAAPIWYGVTMAEPGVSRILSLEAPVLEAAAV